MIRIDLGKEEIGGSKQKTVFGNVKLPANFPTLKTLQRNLRATVMVGASTAVAALLPLFFGQYKSFVVAQHDDKIKSLNAKMDSLGQQVNKYTPFQKELESYEQQRKIIADRLAVVGMLLDARDTPVNVMDAVGQSLPARSWVTQLELKLAAESSVLALVGKAFSNEDISDYIDKLSESVYLGDVNLEEVTVTTAPGVANIKAFIISAKPRVKAIPGMPKSSPAPPNPVPLQPPPGQAQAKK